jgi:pre-rRNA-processing protein TSR4
LFGAGFGEQSEPIDEGLHVSDEAIDKDDASVSSKSASAESLLEALTSTRLEDSPWSAAPHHDAWYLSTAYEYVEPPPKPKASLVSAEEDDGNFNLGSEWSSEAYENSLETDRVFDRFSARVRFEPQQCVR